MATLLVADVPLAGATNADDSSDEDSSDDMGLRDRSADIGLRAGLLHAHTEIE